MRHGKRTPAVPELASLDSFWLAGTISQRSSASKSPTASCGIWSPPCPITQLLILVPSIPTTQHLLLVPSISPRRMLIMAVELEMLKLVGLIPEMERQCLRMIKSMIVELKMSSLPRLIHLANRSKLFRVQYEISGGHSGISVSRSRRLHHLRCQCREWRAPYCCPRVAFLLVVVSTSTQH